MKEFLMIFRGEAMSAEPTAEQINEIEKQWADWLGSIAAAGKYAGGTRPDFKGKTIRPGNVITDGPYAEVKEILMGTTILKVETMDEAVEIAKGCPILLTGGSVEVRGVISMEM